MKCGWNNHDTDIKHLTKNKEIDVVHTELSKKINVWIKYAKKSIV